MSDARPDRGDLVHVLDDRGVADWVIVERDREVVTLADAPGAVRREQRVGWTLIVHDDSPAGRGTARVELDTLADGAEAIVDRALALARRAVGQAWAAPPPAAPAKVVVVDPALADRAVDLVAVGARFARALARPAGLRVELELQLARDRVVVQARQAFEARWVASDLRASALVASDAHSLIIARAARRLGDLELDRALAEAAADVGALATAGAPRPGPCAVRLGADAMLATGALGVWAPFAEQADAVVERQGLTRYRVGVAISMGAAQLAEPLSITSDGALDFGLASAPLGDGGDAVRRFPIVERGVAAGLGLSLREAALRRRNANGGVRNLVVAAGSWSGDPADIGADAARVIDIRRVRSLAIDAYTGEAVLELGLAIERAGGAARPFVGGTVRLDLIDALARARRTATIIRRGAYVGPDAVLIADAALEA